jgi:hypothetical protein
MDRVAVNVEAATKVNKRPAMMAIDYDSVVTQWRLVLIWHGPINRAEEES